MRPAGLTLSVTVTNPKSGLLYRCSRLPNACYPVTERRVIYKLSGRQCLQVQTEGNMKDHRRHNCQQRTDHRSPWLAVITVSCLLVTLVAILMLRTKPPSRNSQPATATPTAQRSQGYSSRENQGVFARHSAFDGAVPRESAAQIVARKAARFARSRREALYAIARELNLAVPAEVEQFFDAAEAGNWEQVQALFNQLKAERKTQPHPPELDQLWAPILTTLNALQQVHGWPPQEYLAYGNAILDSLRPGMVYVGGTDPGRGIPELLSDTSDGEKHIVITQNGLADPTYLEYLRSQYGDRLALPSPQDTRSAVADYVADYQQRLAHDQQSPDEPKQVLPGERVGNSDNFGNWTDTSIMAVNERIFQMILRANPDMPFGLEESYPLKSTYAGASTLGPIMELRAQDNQNPLTADTAGQSLAYWQDLAQQLLSDPAASGSPEWLKAYAKMVDAQANLFSSHGLNAQAEQAFRLALQMSPGLSDPVLGYVDLLLGQNRPQDALAVAQSAAQAQPDNSQFQNLLTRLQNIRH
jgi:hypothetical protein